MLGATANGHVAAANLLLDSRKVNRKNVNVQNEAKKKKNRI